MGGTGSNLWRYPMSHYLRRSKAHDGPFVLYSIIIDLANNMESSTTSTSTKCSIAWEHFEKIARNKVEAELRAQVKRFCELTGHLPSHMDGHQHVHVLPEVREVFAQVLSDFGISYTRVPVEPGLHLCPFLPPHLRDFYLHVEKDALQSVEVFHRHGIRWPNVYLGLSTMGQNMSHTNLKRALGFALEAQADNLCADSFRPITAELMVHPGYPSHPLQGGCGEGPDDFSQSSDRLHELNTLRDPTLHSYYKQQGILLCAFNDF